MKRFNKIYLIDSMTSSKMENSAIHPRKRARPFRHGTDRADTAAGLWPASVIAATAKNV